MMICKADFDELFPSLAATRPRAEDSTPPRPSAGCITRWEDDGGRTPPAAQPRRSPARVAYPAGYGFRAADPARAGLALAMMPAVAAYGVASAMFAAYTALNRG